MSEKYVCLVKDAKTQGKSSVGLLELQARSQLEWGALDQGPSLSPCQFDLILDVMGLGINEHHIW